MDEGLRWRNHQQVRFIRKSAPGPNNRGAFLPGLWDARMSLALTQRELAQKIGSTQGAIHCLERQTRAAHPRTIRKLCAALGVNPTDLLTIEGGEETSLKQERTEG